MNITKERKDKMSTVSKIGQVVETKEGRTFKVTKFDNEHFWGALVVDKVTGKCRKGRPSKLALTTLKSGSTSSSKSAAVKPASTTTAKKPAQKLGVSPGVAGTQQTTNTSVTPAV